METNKIQEADPLRWVICRGKGQSRVIIAAFRRLDDCLHAYQDLVGWYGEQLKIIDAGTGKPWSE